MIKNKSCSSVYTTAGWIVLLRTVDIELIYYSW